MRHKEKVEEKRNWGRGWRMRKEQLEEEEEEGRRRREDK